MMRFALSLFMVILSAPALAQPVAVVSGEHDGYTRLVFSIAPDSEWYLVTGQNSATLVFPDQNIEFEDDGVFARIAKTRLASTHSEHDQVASKYRMTLACDCEVGAFPYQDAYIVVDIVDAIETAATTRIERHFAPMLSPASLPDGNHRPPESVSWILPRAPYYINSPHRVNFPADTDGVGLTLTQTPDTPPDTLHSDMTQRATGVTIEPAQEMQEAVDAARNSLLQQLTLAADQGLLDLNGPVPQIFPAVETEPNDPPTIFEEVESENQILIQTAVARDALTARGKDNPQPDFCPSPENLDMASWGSGEDFFEELSRARGKLLREFDEPDFDELEHLIRTYLRYGFGVEARTYLLEGGDNIAQSSLLLDIAAIVDGQTVQAGGALSQAVDCNGVAGLWALVGIYPAVDTDINDKPSIVAAFSELPPDIRRLVGPRLVSAFLERGFEKTARQLADILERAPGNHGTEHELVIGNLMQVEGSTHQAEQKYQDLIDNNSQEAIGALIELATLGLALNQPPSRHLLLDLGVNAKIWRGTHKGGELRRLEALWLAKQGREVEAIELLVAEIQQDQINADILRKTAVEILLTLSESENLNNNYAEIVHAYIGYIPDEKKFDNLRLKIATKLLFSSLPDYAIDILQPALQRDEGDATLMAASASLQAFRPEAALSLLNGVTGDLAKTLRVEAYLGMGNFEYALEQLNQFSTASAAVVKPYWFKGDWALTTQTNKAAAEIQAWFFPDDTQVAHDPDKLSISETLTLSAMQGLLADSQSRSAELENVLLQR